MNKSLLDAIKDRRTYYNLGKKSVLSDTELQKLLEEAILHVPSAFNSQSTRLVLLTGEAHERVWNIVKDELRKIVPAEAFAQSEAKINGCFAAGYGTVLFFEDQKVVKGLQEQFPLYAESFPTFAEHTNAMHQFAVWTLLEAAGYGASLQHYNPLIDAEVAKAWNINANWKLVAQMPFGSIEKAADEKSFQPVADRLKVFNK